MLAGEPGGAATPMAMAVASSQSEPVDPELDVAK
jgi:hypothetical protein